MVKAKKKRNKKYTGRDAKKPIVTTVKKVEAVSRNPVAQWFHDHKKLVKRVALVVVIGGIFIFVMIQAFSGLK